MSFLPLALALALYPSAPSLWQSGALTSETLLVPESPQVVDNDQLSSQLALYRQLKSPVLRSRMVVELRESHNLNAYGELVKLLGEEEDAFVRNDILETLLALQEQGQTVPVSAEAFIPFFQSPSASSRGLAMRLYAFHRGDEAFETILQSLGNERSPLVFRHVLAVLSPRISAVPLRTLQTLYAGADASNLALRGLLLELLGRRGDAEGLGVLGAALDESNPWLRRCAVVGMLQVPDFGDDLLQLASRDRDPGVRLSVASMEKPGPGRVKILTELLNDSSSAVRAAAARSLGTSGSSAAASALVRHLADSDLLVRWAVCDGLIALRPGRDIQEAVLLSCEKSVLSRRQGVRIMSALGAAHAGPRLERWLRGSQDDLLTAECIVALGHLGYRAGSQAVLGRMGSESAEVRTAIAGCLGDWGLPETFGHLKTLYRDPLNVTSEAAMASMQRLSKRDFLAEYRHALGTRTTETSNRRAHACRALARLGLIDAEIVKQVRQFIDTECIIVPMSGPMADTEQTRISGLLYFLELGKGGNGMARDAYLSSMEQVKSAELNSALRTECMDVYITQLEALWQGKPIPQPSVPTRKVIFSTSPLPCP